MVFANGQMPPKNAIREVRINNNPYSAENEYMGWNGIERIFSLSPVRKSGTAKP